MARAVFLIMVLGLLSPYVMAETAAKPVPAPTVSLDVGALPAFAQPLSSHALFLGSANTAVVLGVPDLSVVDASGRNPFGFWPEMRYTGRLAPPDIFVPPKADCGFGCAARCT